MSFKETFSINGEQLLKKVKEIVAEGNVTKISIADKSGKEIMSFPVTLGIIGVVFAPIFAAVGALAALLTECKITVERKDKDQNDAQEPKGEEPTTDVQDNADVQHIDVN